MLQPARLALALAVVAAACQVKSKPRPDEGDEPGGGRRDAGAAVVGPRTRVLPPAVPPSRMPEPRIELPRELRFTLLDPGQGARARLRYRADGSTRELVARAQVTTRSYADGTWIDPVALAPVRDGFGVTATATATGSGAGAVIQLRGLVASVDGGAAPPAAAAAEAYLGRWRALLERRRADVTIDDRGRLVTTALLDDPTGARVEARDELVQRWLGLAVPLPEEPVAIGARWRVVTALRAGGAVLKQTATYQLRARDAQAWTIDVEAERIGEPQDILAPGVPGGVLGEVVALRRVVKGTLVVGPSDPLPRRGTLASEVASHARFHAAGRTTERYTEDQAAIELGPGAPAPPRP
ncbi:MAG: hypothetical protein KJZ91_00085 [Myxococcales bacterium]|nr:hypothetical protein [Myxococcales bacterium]